ncbi:MAG: signal peptidase I [Bacteroidia bacterium]|nr:signal peptidase I [Bacteroidia bacterium]MDW8157278.1 signal peptidase I [Bacteroidia bacterium]
MKIQFKKFFQSFFSIKKPQPASKKKKSILREWLDAFVFAGGAALIIRTFVIEAFVIPTSSMERSLMVGDFLFVSKFHYGTRLPMVPLSIPFVHNRIPGTHIPSFLEWIVFPYVRLPGITQIQRNDIVVFNFPAEDLYPNDPLLGPISIPSMKENYIKRCVAIPGDVLEIKDDAEQKDQFYINGKKAFNPPNMQLAYLVKTNGEGFNEKVIAPLGFRPPTSNNYNWYPIEPNYLYRFDMPKSLIPEFKKWSNVVSITQAPGLPHEDYFTMCFPERGRSFPYLKNLRKNGNNFGPLLVPRKGQTIPLDTSNIAYYYRAIQAYEKRDIRIKGDKIFIDGKLAKEYTFQMNYYFMAGDNRYNSQDSRYWGLVPEDHIVGKPLFVFLSMEGGIFGIRWNRFFKKIE